MCVLLFDVFKGCFLVKKWIGRGMLYIYYWEKLAGKVNFSERNAPDLKSKKVQGIFGETLILTLLSSVDFRLQKHVSDFF